VERELGSQAMRTRAVMVASTLKRATNRGMRGGPNIEIQLSSGFSMSALTIPENGISRPEFSGDSIS
jgi:hypothetical protein